MKKYSVYMLMSNRKAIRYSEQNMTKADAIKAMKEGWGKVREKGNCIAMYVANLNNDTIASMVV